MKKASHNIAILISIVLTLVWVFVPIFFALMVSFGSTSGRINGLWLGQFSLEHYAWILTGPNRMVGPVRNSVVIASGTTVLVMLLGLPAGYGLAHWRSLAGRVIYTSAFGLRTLPPVTLVIPLFILFARVHLLDSPFAVILALGSLNAPTAIWLMTGYFRTVPRELEEAAWIDGASAWNTFARVVIPVVRQAIGANAIYVFLTAYISYIIPLALSRARSIPLPVYIGSLQLDFLPLTEEMVAASLLGAIPLIALYILLLRREDRGLVSSILK